VDPVVIHELGQREPLSPVILLVVNICPQVPFHFPVHSLSLTINLQMICHAGISFYTQHPVKVLDKSSNKSGASITVNLGREALFLVQMVLHDPCCSLC
jgi:hypothetical protein